MAQDDRLARMTAQFRALHAIDVAISASLEPDEVLHLILHKAVELVGAEHGSLRLLAGETGDLPLRAYLGDGWTPQIQAYTPRVGQGIAGWVAQQRRPYLCPDARSDPRYVVLFPDMQSTAAVPLLARGPDQPGGEALLGVLLLESARPAAFDEQDVELLQALAQVAVIAIQNAGRYRQLQAAHRALRDEQERRLAAEKWTVMGQAATALAHRMNNLVGVILASDGEVNRALARLDAGETLADADRAWLAANVNRIERNARYVLKLSDALFRPFKEPERPILADINRVVEDALEAAGLPPNVEVARDLEAGLPPVRSGALVDDIFVELINNAAKAMARSGGRKRIAVRTRAASDAAGRWVVVQIEDTGGGVAPEAMDHLWDLFQPSADGLGFGLWWVRTFVERQGGHIACDNRPGDGLTFTLWLSVEE